MDGIDQYKEIGAIFLAGGAGTSLICSIILWSWRNALNDLKKIPGLEMRLEHLEKQAMAHSDAREAVARMEEKITSLTDQVRTLSDLLMRKVFKDV